MFVLLELFALQGKSSAGLLHLGLQGQYIVRRSLTNSALSCPCKLAGNGAESAANSLGISRVNDRSTCHMLVTLSCYIGSKSEREIALIPLNFNPTFILGVSNEQITANCCTAAYCGCFY